MLLQTNQEIKISVKAIEKYHPNFDLQPFEEMVKSYIKEFLESKVHNDLIDDGFMRSIAKITHSTWKCDSQNAYIFTYIGW